MLNLIIILASLSAVGTSIYKYLDVIKNVKYKKLTNFFFRQYKELRVNLLPEYNKFFTIRCHNRGIELGFTYSEMYSCNIRKDEENKAVIKSESDILPDLVIGEEYTLEEGKADLCFNLNFQIKGYNGEFSCLVKETLLITDIDGKELNTIIMLKNLTHKQLYSIPSYPQIEIIKDFVKNLSQYAMNKNKLLLDRIDADLSTIEY